MDRKEFYIRMGKLAELFNREMTSSIAESYFEALKSYPREKIIAAFKHVSETERFFPPIVSFKDYLGSKMDALQICNKIEETLRSGFGRYHYEEARKFMGEQAYKAIEMLGGWESYCNMEPLKAKNELIRCCAKVCSETTPELKGIGYEID